MGEEVSSIKRRRLACCFDFRRGLVAQGSGGKARRRQTPSVHLLVGAADASNYGVKNCSGSRRCTTELGRKEDHSERIERNTNSGFLGCTRFHEARWQKPQHLGRMASQEGSIDGWNNPLPCSKHDNRSQKGFYLQGQNCFLTLSHLGQTQGENNPDRKLHW